MYSNKSLHHPASSCCREEGGGDWFSFLNLRPGLTRNIFRQVYLNKSLHGTISQLLEEGETKLADKLRSEFKAGWVKDDNWQKKRLNNIAVKYDVRTGREDSLLTFAHLNIWHGNAKNTQIVNDKHLYINSLLWIQIYWKKSNIV